MDSYYFNYARSRNRIITKKGKYPKCEGYVPKLRTPVDVVYGQDGLSIYLPSDFDINNSLINIDHGSLYIPTPTEPSVNDKYLISRFLGKMSLEVLAQKLINVKGGIDEIIDKPEIDKLRYYVRYGNRSLIWPYHIRRIYKECVPAVSNSDESYEVLHEYTLLYTNENELFFVIIILGIEYAINIGGPEIDGYIKWIEQNHDKSPLYL